MKMWTNSPVKRIELEGKGRVHILDAKGRVLESHEVPLGSVMRVKDGEEVKQRGKKEDAAAGGAVMDTVATLLESAEEVGGVTIVVGEVPLDRMCN